MADYAELDGLIGRIKRAAIDVYMTSEENFYEVRDGRYFYRGSGRGMSQWCTRPGEGGEGGGDVSMDGMPDFLVNHLDDDFRAAFDTIRGQVDDLFVNLRRIPDGVTLVYEERRPMEAAGSLAPRGATSTAEGGGSSLNLNNAVLAQRVNMIHGLSYRLSSRTINAFREAYADRLGAILDGQSALAATLGMAAAGQVAVFKKLREDVAVFATEALASLEALAGQQSSGGGAGAAFQVGGALLSIASLVGGPGGAALSAAGTLSGLIGGFWPAPPEAVKVSFDGADLSAQLKSMADGKTAILQAAADDEAAIRQALQRAASAVRAQPGSFDISRPEYPASGPGQEGLGGPGTIEHNHHDMQRLAAGCQLVSDIVDEAHSRLAGADEGSGQWSRPDGIGIGPSGPYWEFQSLCHDVVALTRNTASELAEAATKLIAASLDFQATDAEVMQALGREMRELRQVERIEQGEVPVG